MGAQKFPYRIYPSGDSAIKIDFGNKMDEGISREIIARFYEWKSRPLTGMIEAVPSYSCLTIYFDLPSVKRAAGELTVFDWIKKQIEQRFQEPAKPMSENLSLKKIPVCYEEEFAADIKYVAKTKGISIQEVVEIHSSVQYRVYMLGFLPGFAYMGEVDTKLQMPRKSQPVPVTAGSVGIAGKQTGIYPLNSPGGWYIIGKTPCKLFNPGSNNPTLLTIGDTVLFYAISKKEYDALSRHLSGQ